ncbi:MAG TPA: ABC transporter substrate-binding protein, partial [Trueperaceae bacterium]|nr:ABC transporter substrate-binding protein [Trueperaceae bacterium]
LYDVFINAVARPSTVASPNYAEVSRIFSSAVHSVLTGEETAENALALAELDIQDLTGLEIGQP